MNDIEPNINDALGADMKRSPGRKKANPPQIHSDETREELTQIIWHSKADDTIVNNVLKLLAKEQTRLLDRVLEGLPKSKNTDGGQYSITPKEFLGYNQALTDVTTTIQKLKGG